MAQGTGWNRREFVSASALLALALGIPVAGCATTLPVAQDAPGERQVALMRAVAQAVIPATDTPGAGDAGAGEFAILALAHGLDGTARPVGSSIVTADLQGFRRADGSLRYVDWLEAALDRRAGGDWLGKAEADRAAILAAIDAEAYAAGAGEHPWKAVKALILWGYYTSEAGGSQELAYAAVPGRFEPKVPVTPATRAFSNDWTSVDFG